MIITHFKTSLNKFTFSNSSIRNYVVNNCTGRVLNLFAGETLLGIPEVRNDVDQTRKADYNLDALEFVTTWVGDPFDTIILDPPYSYRKSMEMYNGKKCSTFNAVKDNINRITQIGSKTITFGYISINMGETRGWVLDKLAVMSHGGAIHDTLISIERRFR